MDSERKPERPQEQEAVFTTIVGGRPPGSGTRVGAIPRGVEVLLKKASVDPEFRKLLLEKRAEAAKSIDLELTDAEREMLASIPAEQLEQIIRNTKVKPEHRAVFLGVAGTLMVAAVIGVGFMALTPSWESAGITVKRADEMKMPGSVDANDPNAVDPNLAPGQQQPGEEPWQRISRGISPD